MKATYTYHELIREIRSKNRDLNHLLADLESVVVRHFGDDDEAIGHALELIHHIIPCSDTVVGDCLRTLGEELGEL